MTVQVWFRARVWPQVEVVRNGHWVVMRRMVRGAAPGLVSVRVREVVWPEGTWPKLRMLPGESGPPMMARVLEPVP